MECELQFSSFLFNFSIDIYKILRNADQNICISPFSISTVLAMTALGAKGQTLEQLRSVLHIQDIIDEKFHQFFGDMIKELNERTKDYTLQVANKLFLQDGFQIDAKYVESSDKFYSGAITAIDFFANVEHARVKINTWVEEKTQNKITDLLQPGIIDAMTRLVLVNALYFKGNWMKQFDVANTIKHPFHLTNSETKEVDMMYQKSKFKFTYSEDLKCKLLELPYTNGHLSMYILLPDDFDGLTDLEDNISVEILNEMISSLHKFDVHVRIPKFKVTEKFSLKDKLSKLGLSDLFSEDADLSGIYGLPGQLYVGAVEHKAFIEVNEEGSEAAAATAAVFMLRCSMMTPEVHFIADHPFLYFIRDNSTGVILFIGSLRQF